jgi:hypothetical protein
MKVLTHVILQGLALAAQYGNLATNVVPVKYKPLVTVGITAAQGILAWYNHYYNPDGTPAAVAYVKPQ